MHQVDEGEISATERTSAVLVGGDSAVTGCEVTRISTPPGGGSPAGLHTHAVDQLFFILRGSMSIEVAEERFVAGPGALVVFPAGVPHRNWNEGPEATLHLAMSAPRPDPSQPFARPAGG